MILEYPLQFFTALFLLTLAAGFWLGARAQSWRVKRLETKIELYRLGIR